VDPAALSQAIHKARFDPLWFVHNVLRIEVDPWQLEMLEAVCDIERSMTGRPTKYNHEARAKFTFRSMHGPGKTYGVALLSHWWQFTRMGRVVCTAPKEKQLTSRFFPEFSKVGSRAIREYRQCYEVGSLKVLWADNNDYFLVGETARDPESLAGFHHDYLLFIVEEASGVREDLFPVIEGAVSTGIINVLMLIGNPTKNVGTFYGSHKSADFSHLYYRCHVSLDKTTRVDPKWVEDMERKYGKNSPIVKIRCLGEFADADPNQLISIAWLERAMNDERRSDGSIPHWKMSIDVSDGGEDETVFTLAQEFHNFILMRRCARRSYEKVMATKDACYDALEILRAFSVDPKKVEFIVDSLGVGAGVRDELLNQGYSVAAFKGGASSSNNLRWRNKRVQSYWSLHNALRDGRVVYADDFFEDEGDVSEYEAQMSSIRTQHSIEKIEDLQSKEQMRRIGVKSPDMSDSSMMLFSDVPVTVLSNAEDEVYGVIGESYQDDYYDAVTG
jgi:hypothetical protein